MAIVAEITAQGELRFIDDAKGGDSPALNLRTSVTITLPVAKKVTIADSTSNQAVQFDSVTAGKVIGIRTDGAVTVKINGEATGRVVNPLFVWIDSAGGLTAMTLTNTSGATRTVEVLIGG
jgi:hypothetical protein